MPTPVQLVLMFTALGNGVAEAAKLGQTEAGQAWLNLLRTDRERWDAFVKGVPGWFRRLFNGELFGSDVAKKVK